MISKRKPKSTGASVTVNIKKKTSPPNIIEDIKVRRIRRNAFVKTRNESSAFLTEAVLFLQAFKAGIEVSQSEIHSFLDSTELKLLEDSDRDILDNDISNIVRILVLSYISRNILDMEKKESIKYAMDYVAEEKATSMKHNMLKDIASKTKNNKDPSFISLLKSLQKQPREVPFGELKERKKEK